jgi:hypothetical protein|tara:strand:+ start:1126 stop:1263 length:138 start_codon:yes stop_codon:yes gene_type:complete
MMKKVKELQLTQQEWFDATRVPPPHRDKTKQYRKEKHKKTWIPEE